MKFSRIQSSPAQSVSGLKGWFGPFAFLRQGESFSQCEICAEPLTPLLQIDVASVRERFSYSSEPAYFQLFYCCNEECEEYGSMDDPAADNFLARIASDLVPTPVKGSLDFSVKALSLDPLEADDEEDPAVEDKIGGYAAWIHEETYAHCKKCRNGDQMEFRIQFTMDEIEGLPFPEGSVLFVSQCKVHPDEFGMIWQCS